MQRFGWLENVAKVVAVVGWLTVAAGAVLTVMAFSSDEPATFLAVGVSISTVLSGLILVLGSGAVMVLIAIEGNTRPSHHPVPSKAVRQETASLEI